MKWVLLTFALLTSGSANALDEKYKFCALTGWFHGFKDTFTADLAQMKISDPLDSTCQAVWRDAFSRAEAFSKNGKVTDKTDGELLGEGFQFKSRINSFILKGAGY